MAPSPIGRNGRASGGRFAKGNPGGPGNPHGKRVAELRAALLEAVTVEDIKAVVRSLVGQARAGEIPAARELLSRVLGKSPDDAEQEQPVVIEVITGVPERDSSPQGCLAGPDRRGWMRATPSKFAESFS